MRFFRSKYWESSISPCASKAHEAASLMLCSIAEKKGDMLRYYNTTGTVRAVGVSHTSQPQLIEFYIETLALEDVEVRDLAGNLYTCQVSPHPRGRKISFIDSTHKSPL